MTTRQIPPQPPRDEPERDPWLSHALRHAPDADAAPAPELSDAILRAARNSVTQPSARDSVTRPSARNTVTQPSARSAVDGGRGSRLAQWWSWLARPPVAAGFATVMVGVLVGLMWIDKPMDEALLSARVDAPAPIREAESTTSPAVPTPSAAAAPSAPAGSLNQESTRGATESSAREPSRAVTAPASRPQTAAKRELRAAESSAANERAANGPAAQAAAPAAPQSATPAPFADNATQAAAAPDAAGKMIAAERARRSEDLAERRAAADDAAAARAPLAKSAPAPAQASVSPPAPALASSPALALRAAGASASPAEAPLIIDAPQRWRWQQPGAGEPRAMTDALRMWIEQLHRSVRWRQDADAPAAAQGPVETLVLWRDGVPYATIEIGASSARLSMQGRPTLIAPLTQSVSTKLTESLLAATR